MERKRIEINNIETDYVAYDNGTIFDERSRRFVDILFKSTINGKTYNVPMVELWFRGERNLLVLKDLIASLFLENPYPDYKPNVGYISDDVSDNSVNNIFYIPPCMELKKLDPEYIAEQERKQQQLEERRLMREKRAKRHEELERLREERRQRIEAERARIEKCVPLVCKLLIEGYTDGEIYNRIAVPPTIITAIRYQGAYPEIATAYGITPDNPPLPSPPYYVFRICERILDNMPSKAIATELGLPVGIVKSIRYDGAWAHVARLYGIVKKDPPDFDKWHKNRELSHKIIATYKENMSITPREIAELFNIEFSKEFATHCRSLKQQAKGHVQKCLKKSDKIN